MSEREREPVCVFRCVYVTCAYLWYVRKQKQNASDTEKTIFSASGTLGRDRSHFFQSCQKTFER